MKMKNWFSYLIVLSLFALVKPTSLWAVDFVHEVMPIIKKHCAECHAGPKKKGGLAMNTRTEFLAGGENGKVVIPGNAGKSLFIELILSDDDTEYMPPKGPRVSPEEVTVLKKWINDGMDWEPGITLSEANWEPPLKPRTVTLPAARNGRTHPIDRLLDAGLVELKQPLPPRATDAAFLRRATLDVIGLLPSPEDLKAFIADTSKNKRETLIDQLLAKEVAYADHWLTTWNDLLRNDYTGTGFITGGRKQITSWLYIALRENKPYDQFVRELIAPTADSSGFIDGIKWRGEVNASQTRDIQFAQNVSQVFLGINMKCASCHDSFIDRWTLSEAYNLASIYAEKPLELNRCDKPTGVMATPKWIFPELGNVDPKAGKSERLQQLAGLMTHPENGRFTRTVVNRVWHRLMGRGIVHPVDAMHTQPWNEDLLDYLAVRFSDDRYDLKKYIRFVMTSQAYQSQTVILEKELGADYVYAGPVAKRMTAEQLIDAIWQVTETHPKKAEAKVDRAERSPVQEAKAPPGKMKALPINAKWIWHQGAVGRKSELRHKFTLDAAPAAARLMATCDNAFKMKLNGKIVAASTDWTKPVYIDLAAHLVKGKNHIEVAAEMFGGAAGFICQLQISDAKVIVTDKGWEARSPGGTWAAAKELHPHGNGPWKKVLDPNGTTTPAVIADSPPVRAALVKNDFLMRSLGRPHRDQVVTTRPAELTTLQAIDLSNGEIFGGYLSRGAKNLMGRNLSGGQLNDWLFQFALSRKPTDAEQKVMAQISGDGSNLLMVEDLLWLVFMQPEFQMIR